MENAYVVTGTLKDDRTLTLDEPLPAGVTRVRVTVEPLSHGPVASYEDTVATLRARQHARGYVPPTREDVDFYLAEERESWGE